MQNQMENSLRSLQICFTTAKNCGFDKSLTTGSIFVIFIIFLFSAAVFYLLKKKKTRPFKRFFLMSAGVLFFEMFTAPLWNNAHLGLLGYIYADVSWILTIGWSSLFLFFLLVFDKQFPKMKMLQRTLLMLIPISIVVFCLEVFLIQLGIRSYAPEIYRDFSQSLFGAPLMTIVYAPVFALLVMSFYRYWEFSLDGFVPIPFKKKVTLRNFAIVFIGVFLFEMVVEPLVENKMYPSWSYIFHDINLIRIMMWVGVIAVSTILIDNLFPAYRYFYRFMLYCMTATALFYPLETWLINNGYRVYSFSTRANFTGFLTPIGQIPVEILFAFPLYLAIIMSFVRYWRIVSENKL